MMENIRKIWSNKKLLAIVVIIVVMIVILPTILFSAPFKIAIYGEDYRLSTYTFIIEDYSDTEENYTIKLPIPRNPLTTVWDMIEDVHRLDGNISMSQIVETRIVLESDGPTERQLDYLKITGSGNARVEFRAKNIESGYLYGLDINGTVETYFESSGNDVSVGYSFVLTREFVSPSGTTDYYDNPYYRLTPNFIAGCIGAFEQNGWYDVELNFVNF